MTLTERETAASQASPTAFFQTQCHAGKDGDCIWDECPQLRDGEPKKTGRHCPLDDL